MRIPVTLPRSGNLALPEKLEMRGSPEKVFSLSSVQENANEILLSERDTFLSLPG
jgi:hypothetical protein